MRLFTWQQRGIVFLVTVSSIMVFGGTGMLIDHFAQSRPLGLVLGVLISFPVTQVVLAKVLRAHHKKQTHE